MATTHDDAFREIQLNGKQLVFMAMAVVVIGVGIFLMGVLVGRGVRAERGLPDGTEGSMAAATETEPPLPPASMAPGSSDTPITAGEKLSYAERLTDSEASNEALKKAGDPPDEAPTPKPEVPVTPEAAAPAPVAAPAAAAPAEPPGTGFAIQLAALRERSEADTMVKRLAGKGYPAYVLAPAKGAPAVYRVRVGKFKDRREADTVAARLQKEEQFKPWVVR
ncbi:MAG: SPOR domain-containing protein [Vicinamibacterales bacterium]